MDAITAALAKPRSDALELDSISFGIFESRINFFDSALHTFHVLSPIKFASVRRRSGELGKGTHAVVRRDPFEFASASSDQFEERFYDFHGRLFLNAPLVGGK